MLYCRKNNLPSLLKYCTINLDKFLFWKQS